MPGFTSVSASPHLTELLVLLRRELSVFHVAQVVLQTQCQ